METVRAAAARAGAWVSIGVNERDPAGGTLYNTQLYFTPDGQENYMPLARYAGPRGEVLAGPLVVDTRRREPVTTEQDRSAAAGPRPEQEGATDAR